MIDINLMAADFDAELNKVREWNNEKREIRLQERGAGENAARIRMFLQELSALSKKYDIYIDGCGCCGSPWIEDKRTGKEYDFLTYKNQYEVDGIGNE